MKKTPYWWATIDRAEKRGHFTRGEIAKAESWVTCACGRQDKRIPRYQIDPFGGEGGCPLDPQLEDLGTRFCEYVRDFRVAHARTTLTKIEKRAAEVLAEVTK